MRNPLLAGLTLVLALAGRATDEAAIARFTPWFMPMEFYNPKLSPTGEYLGFILRDGDTYVVGLLEFATGRLSYAGGKSDLLPFDFWWKGPRRLMVRVVSNTGNRRSYASFDIDGKNPQELWKIEENGGTLLDPLPNDPDHILMAHSKEVYRLDLGTGKTTKVDGDTGHVNRWILDTKGNVRAASIRNFTGARILWWRATSGGEWRSYKMKPEDRGISPLAFDEDPRYLWVWDFTASPAVRLSKFDTQDGSVHPVIGPYEGLDPTHMLSVNKGRQPIAVGYMHANPVRLEPLTESHRAAVALLQQRFKGALPNIVDSLPNDKNWILWSSTSQFPGGFFLFDPRNGQTSLIATAHSPTLKQSLFVASTPLSVASRSGGKIHGRVWLPAGIARPPLIVLCPASIPALPASDAFNPLIQALAANGLAVAVFDGRSTIGYGHDTDVLSSGSLAKVLQDDLEDGLAGLAAQGVVDGRRAGLLGEGMAGVIAQAVADVSDKFRAVASINAPLEIERTDLLSVSMDTSENAIANRLGGWRESAKLANALSPLKVAPRLRVPALHLMDEAPWNHGKPSDDAKKLEKAVRKAPVPGRVELAYSWYEGFTPPSVYGREHAALALRIAEFFQTNLTVK